MAWRNIEARTRSYRFSAEWRNRSRSSQAASTSAVGAPAIRSRTERLRTAGSGLVMVAIRVVPRGCMGRLGSRRCPSGARGAEVLLDPHDRLEQPGEHPLAVDPRQGQGDLGLDEPVLDPEVVPGPAGLERQVLLASRQRVQRGGEL